MRCQVNECQHICGTLWNVSSNANTTFTPYEIDTICEECMSGFLEKNPLVEEHLTITYSTKTIKNNQE